MRFDDTLDTVLAADLDNPIAAQSAWRQLVDLVGRGRIPAGDRAMNALRDLAKRVPVTVRAASARALFGAAPPPALVRLLAIDEIAVAASVLRTAHLDTDAWVDLLPALSPAGRAILRHRKDLPIKVERALESFGAVDFVIATSAEPAIAPAGEISIEEVPPPVAPGRTLSDAGPFVSVGSIARSIPVVAEALRREAEPAPPPAGGTFRIADVVARIEAYREKRANERRAAPDGKETRSPTGGGLRFETDERGTVRWVEGAARGTAIGLSLAHPGRGLEGVDAGVAGAFRQRSRFSDLHLTIGGAGMDAGLWLISGIPVFDPATGRFTGYRGSGRRPRQREVARAPTNTGDALRQLVHELRTPMNAIAGFSEMIEHQMLGPVADPYRRDAQIIHRDARKLLDAIEDIDIAARLESQDFAQQPEAINLVPIVTALIDDLASEGVIATIDGEAKLVWGDRRGIERIVRRLIGVAASVIGPDESVKIIAGDAGSQMSALSVLRPAALHESDDAALFDIGGEEGAVSLLGVGFALRLVRSLASELGGRLIIERDRLTLHLPRELDSMMEQARPH